MNNKDVSRNKPLVDSVFQLKKFPGKGGWTYAEIPEISPDKKNPFGWVIVRGWIDGYELKQVKLLPKGGGQLFLPVKAAIRKHIKKMAGDQVRITLYLDQTDVLVPAEIIQCFEYESKEITQAFLSLSKTRQKSHLDWIYQAKSNQVKANRIAELITKLAQVSD